jgi:hypothetical protein
MKRMIVASLTLALMMCAIAVAQYGTTQGDQTKADTMKSKAVSISGKIGADGQTFVSDKDGKSWTISNPEAVKGHEGHHVIVTAQVDKAKSELQVVSLKMAKAAKAGEMKD